MRPNVRVIAAAAATALVILAGCSTPTPPPPPLPDPALNLPGPLSAPVGSTVDFQVANISGEVIWSVDDVVGGTTATGTVTDGSYQAPTRVPTDPTVTVTATDAAAPARQASAEVTITAPGTLYILDDAVYVYNDVDVVDGNAVPDRVFELAGTEGADFYDMAMAPALDTAFISAQVASPNVFRVSSISLASGTIAGTAFDSLTYENPSGLVYDSQRDILYVAVSWALLAFDDASTAPAGQAPTRIVEGPTLDDLFKDYDSRLNLDVEADRLFVSNQGGVVGVYDEASSIDGEVAPDRIFELDAAWDYIWGAAYDTSRDELYLGDQNVGVAVYVVADASTVEGAVTPARSIGGPTNPFDGPSQLSYDVIHDRLVVIDADGDDVKVFDNASTVNGDVAPTRIIGGSELPITYAFSGYLDPTQ